MMAKLRINGISLNATGLERRRPGGPGLRGAYIDNADPCRKRVERAVPDPSVAVPVMEGVHGLSPVGSGGRLPGVIAPLAAMLDFELDGDVADPQA